MPDSLEEARQGAERCTTIFVRIFDEGETHVGCFRPSRYQNTTGRPGIVGRGNGGKCLRPDHLAIEAMLNSLVKNIPADLRDAIGNSAFWVKHRRPGASEKSVVNLQLRKKMVSGHSGDRTRCTGLALRI